LYNINAIVKVNKIIHSKCTFVFFWRFNTTAPCGAS